VTRAFLSGRVKGVTEDMVSDRDANYSRIVQINVNGLVPQIACPHSPDKVVPVSEAAGKKVDQVLIGTCTGGRIEDYRMAAGLMQGKRVARKIRCLIVPASSRIYRQMLEEGLLRVFLDAGCVICNPHCGPCGGVQAGLIADGEVCVSTSNRNFQGRMGSPKGEVYLGSAATAATTALTGELTDPRELA